ncbi:MAG: ABC transporter ATP-binding protein [Gammaproteobacteria bacterium]|nr:ABC transporter ATP-binding protein [Gammaproteobacteria bacterium]MDH5304299.1 ABC transporter ATP-binding protein [Gammaproteobacteria bacterium]
MSLLAVERLNIRYGDRAVVSDLSFAVEAGESVGLVGESGSGKTQTALAVLGLLPGSAATSGSIRIGGADILGASEKVLNEIRARRIAMVFQDPMQALNPYLRVGQALSRVVSAHTTANDAEARQRVLDMLRRVGLADAERQYRAYPHQLSGGMRQRVMIASALLVEPELLIADEPTTALDVTVQAQILELLEDVRDDTALLLITHDLGIVAGRCERMLVLEHGRLVEQGRTTSVFSGAKHAHTQALIAAAPRPDRGVLLAPVAADKVLEIRNAEVSYFERGHGRLRAVQALSLALQAGETVAVVGESGSGKSSLVRAALGLVPLQAGQVIYCGEPLAAALQQRSTRLRRDLQLVFQDPVGSLNPQMQVRSIVAEPLRVHAPELSRAERSRRVVAILDKVGLDESYLKRHPHQLSGGEAQRVAIARALILQPRVLFCDEAVASLDGSVRKQILELLRRVQQETGLAILFITHDLAVVRAISHRVLVMYLGRLVELSGSEALFTRARHPYTQALLQAVPVPDPIAAGGHASLSGETPSILSPPGGCAFHPRCAHARNICTTTRPSLREIDGVTVACHRADELLQPH